MKYNKILIVTGRSVEIFERGLGYFAKDLEMGSVLTAFQDAFWQSDDAWQVNFWMISDVDADKNCNETLVEFIPLEKANEAFDKFIEFEDNVFVIMDANWETLNFETMEDKKKAFYNVLTKNHPNVEVFVYDTSFDSKDQDTNHDLKKLGYKKNIHCVSLDVSGSCELYCDIKKVFKAIKLMAIAKV